MDIIEQINDCQDWLHNYFNYLLNFSKLYLAKYENFVKNNPNKTLRKTAKLIKFEKFLKKMFETVIELLEDFEQIYQTHIMGMDIDCALTQFYNKIEVINFPECSRFICTHKTTT